jgi:hypothetical protein
MDLFFLLLQTLEEKDERGKLQCISTRERGGYWRGQWNGFLEFQMSVGN